MDKQVALDLIGLWKLDLPVSTCEATFKKLKEEGFLTVEYLSARIFLAARNKAASDALWDGNKDVALTLLLKRGLTKDNGSQEYRGAARSTTKRLDRKLRREQVAFTEHWNAHKLSGQWGVCK